MEEKYGTINQVMGPVVDVEFASGNVPDILSALKMTNPSINDKEDNLTLEVASHLGDNVVRTIAMDGTDGLRRGMKVRATGAPIMMPVGRQTLGRILNVIGEPVDELGAIGNTETRSIHRDPNQSHRPSLPLRTWR